MNDGGLGALMAITGVVAVLFLVIGLVFYILKSMGLYTLASRRGIENPWLAWIPIADLYIMGMLVEEMDLFNFHLDNLGLWCPVIFVCGAIGSTIPFLGVVFSLALLIFSVVFIYKLFELYTSQAVLFTILSVLLGLFAVFIFVIRNNDQVLNPPDQSSPSTPY